MVGSIRHYNPRLYSGDFLSEEWEDGLIDQLLSMFNQLGMEMTREQLQVSSIKYEVNSKVWELTWKNWSQET